MSRLALFASGNGSNVQRIAEYFQGHPSITAGLVLCNNPGAYVLERAANLGIPSVIFDRPAFYESDRVLETLKQHRIDFLVLAGFLWLLPAGILAAYPGKTINIHPALLPLYGGKGMYGMRVHEAVIAAGDRESGITIHFVDENYDEGRIIFQAKCNINPTDTPLSLAEKVHALEHRYFPGVIEEIVSQQG